MKAALPFQESVVEWIVAIIRIRVHVHICCPRYNLLYHIRKQDSSLRHDVSNVG